MTTTKGFQKPEKTYSISFPVFHIPCASPSLYRVLSWQLLLVCKLLAEESALLKWLLIGISFVMYGWASYDMLNWCSAFERVAPAGLPSRNLRPLLSSGLVVHLLLYGVVSPGRKQWPVASTGQS